jgi:lipoprotein NlpI
VRFARAPWLLITGLLLSGPGAAAGEYPLLDLAAELAKEREPERRANPSAAELRHARHALEQAEPPTDETCAGTLGAAAFAELHSDVARALKAMGDHTGAARAFRSALACKPRSSRLMGALAEVLFDARDFPAARTAINDALALDPRAVYANRVAGNLDFVEERWADAMTRFRYVAASDEDRDQAGYGQLMFWLAQSRAGVREPQFVERRAGTGWPQPLMLYMRGEYTESELLEHVRDGDFQSDEGVGANSDERLCEALYYVGQAHWARGKPEVARRYFAALVNLRVIYYLEHGLALAEIAKLNK